MAGETLRTVAQMLADWADNNQGLITAVKGRDMIVSEAVNVGYLGLDNGPATVDIVTAGVFVSVNAAITPSAFSGNFWKRDGNNAFSESYTDQGITVPPGTQRLTTFQMEGLFSKVGGGTNVYEFQLFVDGVADSPTGFVQTLTSTPQYVSTDVVRLPDYSLGQSFDFRVACIDGTADLVVDEFRFIAQGVPV